MWLTYTVTTLFYNFQFETKLKTTIINRKGFIESHIVNCWRWWKLESRLFLTTSKVHSWRSFPNESFCFKIEVCSMNDVLSISSTLQLWTMMCFNIVYQCCTISNQNCVVTVFLWSHYLHRWHRNDIRYRINVVLIWCTIYE